MRWRLLEVLKPRRTVHIRGLDMTLQCDNWITQLRTDTLPTREPETLDWIDEHIHAGDVFFDVGGNIGVFTVYATLRHPGALVVAFEPEYANLHLLRDNVVANGLIGRVEMYPFALGDRTGLSRLHVQDLTPGAALHSESRRPLQTTESGARVLLSEGTWTMALDDFCHQAQLWPNAIKIDVDGAESRVLSGARETLGRSSLRTLLVEAGQAGLPAAAVDLLTQRGLSRVTLRTVAPSPAGNEVWARV